MKYRAEIDGLRALAVVPVILFHAGFELFSGGFVGVDVFFVISGYLITTILIEDIENKRFSIVNFYERRARRILPALFFVMLVCIPFAWMWMLPNQMKDFSQSLVAVSLFASNILFWRESGYFDAAAEEKPLLHTWSLAVEEQYYVLFPIFLILAWRFGKNRVFWMIVVMATISLLLSEWGWRNKATANFYLAPTRAWELFAGSIAAFIVQKQGVKKNDLLALVGLAAIIFAIFLYDETTPFPSVYTLVPVLGVVLLVLYSDKETIVAKLLSKKGVVGIGLISYSAYLWHQPLFAFGRIKSPDAPSITLMAVLVVVSFLLAYLSWKYIEKPFRNKAHIIKKKTFFVSVSGILAFTIFGLFGHGTDGFINYTITQQERTILESAVPSPKRQDCHTGGSDYLTYSESCEYFEHNITVAVFGDSHAVELAYALAQELQSEGQGVKHLSFSGCVPIYGVPSEDFPDVDDIEDCASWTEEVVNGIIADERIKSVIITFRIANALYGHNENTYRNLSDLRGERDRLTIWNSLITTINTLNEAGKRTVFVQQAPELPRLIGYLIPSNDDTFFGGVSRSWWRARVSFVYENIDDINNIADVVDLADLFCDEEECFSVIDSEALYFDDNHMSVSGANRAALTIMPLIRKYE
ncbi:acyltransferase [Alphaproteobacteria bacterium]|nr:acyltransferase [Alphaproteobacteria bacterium]